MLKWSTSNKLYMKFRICGTGRLSFFVNEKYVNFCIFNNGSMFQMGNRSRASKAHREQCFPIWSPLTGQFLLFFFRAIISVT